MLSDRDVMRYYPKLLDRRESMEWVERQRARYERDGHGLWLVEERETGNPVGQVGLVMQDLPSWPRQRYPEIGYLLHRPFWGRGFATEAAERVRAYAFVERGFDQVISLIRPVNEPSQAVARRLGMLVRGHAAFGGLAHLVFGIEQGDLPLG